MTDYRELVLYVAKDQRTTLNGMFANQMWYNGECGPFTNIKDARRVQAVHGSDIIRFEDSDMFRMFIPVFKRWIEEAEAPKPEPVEPEPEPEVEEEEEEIQQDSVESEVEEEEAKPVKRGRGRPKGSKNKPKEEEKTTLSDLVKISKTK